MFKIMVLIKRREGTSMANFIDYYESSHSVLAATHLPHTRSYFRHYLTPLGDHVGGAPIELPYDVVTEMVFDAEAEFDKAMEILGNPEVRDAITSDEEHLFERTSITFTKVDSYETDMTSYA